MTTSGWLEINTGLEDDTTPAAQAPLNWKKYTRLFNEMVDEDVIPEIGQVVH